MKNRYLTAGALAGLLGAATAVHAASATHTVAGSSCQPSNNTNVWWTNDMTFNADSDMWIDCPLQRDNINNTNGLTLNVYSGQAQFVTGSFCTARSMGPAGAGVARAVQKNVPGYNSGTTKIDWGSSLNGGYGGGQYTLECWMKKGAYVSQLRWDEN